MTELLWVKPGRDDGRVALFEAHPAHPGGEAFVAGPPVQVALTPMVERKLLAGDLVKCDAPTPVVEPVEHLTREEVQDKIEAMGGVPRRKPKPEPKGKGGL
jgi:hypothetical protein